MLLQVKNLHVEFRLKNGISHAVDDVSFSVEKGEVFAIVGESGSGKSVTSLSIMGLLKDPGKIVGGKILFKDENLLEMGAKKMRNLRGDQISMIFQEPMTSLNPVMRVEDQITESILTHLDRTKLKAHQHVVNMLELVGIPSAADRARDYPHQMSGGMRQRVMIAMALACNPELLIADEPTTALDVTIQAQILELLGRMRRRFNMAVILITHDLGVVAETADRVAVMYCGQIVEMANVADLFAEPLHPYTVGLLGSIPRLEDERGKELYTIDGMVPNPLNLPSGCRFSDRCTNCTPRCTQSQPPLLTLANGRQVRCFLYEEEGSASV